MDTELEFIRSEDIDACPECGNKKGNEIEIYSTSEHKHDEDEKGEATCAKCGLSWMLVYKY